MSRTPTWYSIKNRLESGEVKANNEWERFIASLVTSYGCIDIWYKNISSESNVVECRIFYLQVDSTYEATESWERAGERPKPWMQLKGTIRELRATLISLLPQLSQLHATKRHGEWILGATQPFEGQGSIITRVDIDGTWYLIITGRFGDLVINANGVELNWEDITWSFDGCNPTATAPDGDVVCILEPGQSICGEVVISDPVGTCLTGSCDNWSAPYPVTSSDCSGTWFTGVDYSGWTQEQWNTNQGCVDETGTCVTGTCVGGFSIGTTTQAACRAAGGTWAPSGVQTNQDWIDQLGCLGCCVIGEDCEYPVVRSGMTSAACTTLAAGRPHSWTQNQTAWGGCTQEDVLEDNNCDDDDDDDGPCVDGPCNASCVCAAGISYSCTSSYVYKYDATYRPGSVCGGSSSCNTATPSCNFTAGDFHPNLCDCPDGLNGFFAEMTGRWFVGTYSCTVSAGPPNLCYYDSDGRLTYASWDNLTGTISASVVEINRETLCTPVTYGAKDIMKPVSSTSIALSSGYIDMVPDSSGNTCGFSVSPGNGLSWGGQGSCAGIERSISNVSFPPGYDTNQINAIRSSLGIPSNPTNDPIERDGNSAAHVNWGYGVQTIANYDVTPLGGGSSTEACDSSCFFFSGQTGQQTLNIMHRETVNVIPA